MYECIVHHEKVNQYSYCLLTVATLLPETRENQKKKKNGKR